MKNENSTARGERIRAERIEEDKRVAEAAATAREKTESLAATEAAERAEKDRLMAEVQRQRPPAGSEQAERWLRAEANRDERDRQHVDRVASGGGVTRVEKSGLTLWELHAKNREAPPFHFTNVAHRIRVAAKSAEDARRMAAGAAGDHGAVWLDDEQTDCAEWWPTERGIIAQDLGA